MSTPEQNALLKQYTPLVNQIAAAICRKVPRSVQKDDLVAAGMLGLWDAIRRHSGDDEKFPWYAGIRIRGAIFDELRAQDWLPRHARWVLADQMGLAVVHLEDVSELDRQKALNSEEPFVDVNRNKEKLRKALDQLPLRERDILVRHLIDGTKFSELAQELKVTVPRISQLHSRASKRLQDLMAQAL